MNASTGCVPVVMPSMGMVMRERNACTTVATVTHMSPSAPPCFCKTALRTMIIMLSVAAMKKGESPILTIFIMVLPLYPPKERRTLVLGSSRKTITNSAESPWESTVAAAAPVTPMSNVKMKSGSKAMFATAPMQVVAMAVPA